jgi:hypothetical protein
MKQRWMALVSSILTGLTVAGAAALAAPPGVINQFNAVCDAGFPTRCIAVDTNGAIAVTGGTGGGGAALKATANPPVYVEGSASNPLSSDLSGNMRTLPSARANAAAPSYTEATADPLSMDLSGNLRVTGNFASSLKATAADPGYVEGTNNPFSADLSGYLRSKVKAASGAYASGSIASGAIASGAYAAGSISAGAIAAGAAIDGWDATQGAKSDARSTATDATPVSVVQVLKELSFMAQSPANVGAVQIGAPWSVSQSGTWTVQQGTPPWSVSQSGSPWGITGSGSAGSPTAGVVTVQGITGGTPLPETAIPSSAAVAGIAPVSSAALETGHVLKASAGNLYGVEVTTTGVAGYLEVFNSTTVPAAGAVTPVAHCYVVAFGTCGLQFTPPMVMATGISVAFSASTTPFTKTDSATAAFSGQVQ